MSLLDLIGGSINLVFKELLTMLASVLPEAGTTGIDFANAMNTVMIMGKQFSFLINWGVLFTCVFILVMAQVALLVLKFAMYAIGVLRGGH